jgi:threonine synthase
MRYVSTRGGAEAVSFFDAVLTGLAPDSGLYAPQSWPHLRPYIFENGAALTYPQIAAEVLYLFGAGDLSFAGASDIAEAVYGEGGGFAHPAVAPLRELSANQWLMELFHGPSLAFKDIALQLMAALYRRILEERDARLSVVCATSGDTGGAAAAALAGQARADLFILLPKGRVSDVQRRFMTATGAANVHALEVETDFDGCQALIKALFADRDFATRAQLSGVNSINWARIVAQSAYFIRASLALQTNAPVHFIVPTGNFGDALSAHVARRMGAPIGKVLAATNANAMVAHTFATGLHARQGASIPTVSPAMDILAPSNFERLVYDFCGPEETRAFYASFAQSGQAQLSAAALDQMQQGFVGRAASDSETLAALRQVYQQCGEVLCPHSAAGAAAAIAAQGNGVWPPGPGVSVLLATAHPAKFPDTVGEAIGARPIVPGRCAQVMTNPEVVQTVDHDLGAVKSIIAERSRAWRG